MIEEADWPWADIITTIARRSFTGSLAVLVIFCRRRPSSIDNARTNTPGFLATTTSRNRFRDKAGLITRRDQ
ncbi:hypothetical protein GCM10027589_00790 [Actinocorallia lasiicapitis]